MLKRYHGLILLSMVVTTAGCGSKHLTAHDMQMQAMDRMLEYAGSNQSSMIDNAILHDMSIADIHFVPHSSEISGTGVYRLDRMAPLLNTYGGIVRYETTETDQEMLKARLDHVEEYLSVVGCDMENVQVKIMISGGRGMSAVKALAYENKQGTTSSTDSGGVATLPDMTGASNN